LFYSTLPLALIPAVLIILLVRLIRPLVIIRFGHLISERIGHFAANTEKYLCERDSNPSIPRTIDIFTCQINVCNRQLKKMWQRHLYISPFVRWLRMINKIIPGGEIHNLKLPSDQNFYAYQNRYKPHLSFLPEEESIGKHYLQKAGLHDEDKFLCFFSRDSRYLDEVCAYRSREEWSYHDFRDALIENHVPAIEYMVEQNGYYAFRMGYLVKDRLNTNNPKIIDYASNGDRSELLDLYLCANCHFFLQSGGSGIASVSRVFQRPLVSVNQIPLKWCHGNPVTVFIPKKLWLKEKKRFMTFKEILESDVGMYMRSQDYDLAGIECVQNTPEEITDAVIEADKRIKGIWKPAEEDIFLQEQFQSLFFESELCGRKRSPIGASFLRQNQDLLK